MARIDPRDLTLVKELLLAKHTDAEIFDLVKEASPESGITLSKVYECRRRMRARGEPVPTATETNVAKGISLPKARLIDEFLKQKSNSEVVASVPNVTLTQVQCMRTYLRSMGLGIPTSREVWLVRPKVTLTSVIRKKIHEGMSNKDIEDIVSVQFPHRKGIRDRVRSIRCLMRKNDPSIPISRDCPGGGQSRPKRQNIGV